MKKGYVGKIKILVCIVIVVLFVWFLVLSPMITFHNNEKQLEKAARRYFELNSDKLPVGERVKTLSLSALYKESYLDKDFKIPYSGKMCSVEKSWVKVKKDNGDYKYYVYLDCGILKSAIDHKGPEIKLNGNEEISVSVGEKYKELGVRSVVDDNDGKLDVKDVTIKNNVDTSKIGTYEVKYTAFDSLSNKGEVVRKVKVVKMIKSVVKKDLGKATNYSGNPTNNYVRLSNMLFRIYGINDRNNIILVSNEDVSNVNYSKLDKWLDEVYYKHLNDGTKKILVKSKFCNMNLDESNLNTTQCTSYTDSRYSYIPSVIDVNKAEANGENFMKPFTMSWVANKKDKSNAYLTRKYFFGDEEGKSFLSYNVNDNYGVRPMIVIKGSSLVVTGNGEYDNPYTFGDTKKAKGGDLLNTRFTGEYVENNGMIWRIIDVDSDGTTKVISDSVTDDSGGLKLKVSSMPGSDNIGYNPKKKSNVAYYINNKVSKYIDTSLFVNHSISVPLYNKKIVYGNEVKTKNYKVKLSAPNMYDMFSAQSTEIPNSVQNSYWLINSSEKGRIQGALYDIGVPVNESIGDYDIYGIRVVGYINENKVVSSGDGTNDSPYLLK